VKIDRRFGSTPVQRGSINNTSCPDVLRLDSGDYLVIGKTTTVEEIAEEMRQIGASVGKDETAVIVPAKCVEDAAREIAEALAASA
jgi:hypothetical protein